MNKKILIIEDKTEELIYAQAEAAKSGYRNIAHATNLDQALPQIEHADEILTDLFIPTQMHKEKYITEFLPAYESYRQERFKEEQGASVVRAAVLAWSELFGKETVEQGLEMFETYTKNFDEKGNPNSVLKAARDAVHGVRDYDRYKEFFEMEKNVRSGEQLPLGIIVAREAQKYGIPSVIVTSTYHHDDAFEAVREQITVPYVDTLVDGKKDWASGLEMLNRKVE